MLFGAFVAYWTHRALTDYFLDLAVYRMGGQAMFDGDGLYTLGLSGNGTGLPFTYPPFSALLFTPFAAAPEDLAQVVWGLLMLVAFFVFVRESLRAASPTKSQRWGIAGVALVASACLLFEPVVHNLRLGQINLFLGLAILLDVLRRHGRIPGGVLLGVAAAVKITPMIFVVYYVCIGRYRDARNAIITFIACLGVGALARPSDSWHYWTELAFDAKRVGGVPYVANQSILGALSRVMDGPDNAAMLGTALGAIVMLSGLALAVRAHRHGRPLLSFLTCAMSALLISPISWSHHWVWVVPMAIWLAFGDDAPRWGKPAAVMGSVVLMLGPIWWPPNSNDREFDHNFLQAVEASSFFLLAIGLLVALAVHQLRTSAPAGSTPGFFGRTTALSSSANDIRARDKNRAR
jgi:alpha-1,2-mannosyltransferase